MKKKKLVVGCLTLFSVLALVGCGSKSGQSEKSDPESTQSTSELSEKGNKADEKKARKSATTVLDYLYKNKSANLKDVTGVNGSDMTRILEDTVYESKIADYPGNGWGLEIDESIYTAEDIFRQYSKVYVKSLVQIGDYEITNISVEEDTATITYTVDPIAMNSVANAITWARANVYGGLEASDMIGNSQNTDVKSINNLITFKLYDMIYGDKSVPFALLGEPIEIEFTLKEKNGEFVADADTILDLVKQSQVNEYSKEVDDKEQEKILDDSLGSDI